MKLVLMVLIAGSVAFAQHGGAGGHGSGAGHAARGMRGAQHYAAPPAVSHPGHAYGAIVPYPVFYGGYYFCDPSYCDPSLVGDQGGAPSPANNSYDDSGQYGAPGQPPVVIVNQSYQSPTANGLMHDYSNANLPPPGPSPSSIQNAKPDDQATIYLIAMTDHTILPAIAYWVDGDTLDYITQDGDQNRISLSLVDRDFSRKLNSDRGVEFRLPAGK